MDISKVIKGLSVDCYECDWVSPDKDMSPETLLAYLNTECPKCGANVLTEEEAQQFQRQVDFIKALPDDFITEEEMADDTTVRVRHVAGRGTEDGVIIIGEDHGIKDALEGLHRAIEEIGPEELAKFVTVIKEIEDV